MKLKNIHMYFNVVNVKCEFYLSFAKRATEVYIARFTRKTHQNEYRDNGFTVVMIELINAILSISYLL